VPPERSAKTRSSAQSPVRSSAPPMTKRDPEHSSDISRELLPTDPESVVGEIPAIAH
jgi:hypothetical protein